MPTIIDEFVVTLGLDPRGFNRQQQTAVQNLRGLQQQGQATAQLFQNLQLVLGRAQKQFQGINSAASTSGVGLKNLGAGANRTGLQIASGVNQGSLALSRMTTTALAAYGALKTVQGIVRTLNDSIKDGVETGRRAGYTGTSVGFMSRLAIGANITSGADPGRTQETLFQLRQFAEGVQYGKLNEEQAKYLGMMNNSLGLALKQGQGNAEGIQQQILQRFHEMFRGDKDDARAINFGSEAFPGASRELLVALRRQGPQELERRGDPYKVTQNQYEALSRLKEVLTETSEGWDAVTRAMTERYASAATAVFKLINEQIKDLLANKKGLDDLSTSIGNIATGGALGALLGFISRLGKGAWSSAGGAARGGILGMLLTGIGSFLGSSGATLIPQGVGDPNARRKYEEETFGKGAPTPPEKGWFRRGLDAIFGESKPAAEATIPLPQSGRYTPSQLRQFALAAGFSGEAATRMAAIAYSESKGDPNAVSKTGDYGLTQVNAAAHGDARAKSTLGNPAKAFAEAYRISKGGSDFTPWSDFKNKNYEQYMGAAGQSLVKEMQQGSIRNLPIAPELRQQLEYAASKTGAQVEVYSGGQEASGPRRTGSHRHDDGKSADFQLRDLTTGQILSMQNPADKARMQQFIAHTVAAGATGVGAAEGYMGPTRMHVGGGSVGAWGAGGRSATAPGWVRQALNDGLVAKSKVTDLMSGMSLVGSAKAEGVGSANTTNNTSSIGIGDIHVHTPATDAAGIARDMKGEVQRNLDVTNSNYGLQY